MEKLKAIIGSTVLKYSSDDKNLLGKFLVQSDWFLRSDGLIKRVAEAWRNRHDSVKFQFLVAALRYFWAKSSSYAKTANYSRIRKSHLRNFHTSLFLKATPQPFITKKNYERSERLNLDNKLTRFTFIMSTLNFLKQNKYQSADLRVSPIN